MKRLLFSLSLSLSLVGFAQQFDQVSVGAGYANQTYYSLSSGNTSSSPIQDWEIGFRTGGFEAAVFINEGVISGSSALGALALFETSSTDFNTVSITDTLSALRNPDVTWSEGAFNTPAIATNPLDFGWGAYDMTTNAVNGTRVFIIQLRNGSYKKLFIESLIQGVFTFKWADLDGGNEITRTLDQGQYSKDLVFYSLSNDAVVDVEPNQWDMVFTRYSEELDAGSGTTLEYNVGGALIAPGVMAAQASGVDPNTVAFANYEQDLTDSVSLIGHDWRFFDLSGGGWTTLNDRAYFVQTAADSLFKVVFIDFEGSSTGLITLEKTYLGQYVSTPEFDSMNGFALYPNPAAGRVNLSIDWQEMDTKGEYRIVDLQGRVVYSETVLIQPGMNVLTRDLNLAKGTYITELVVGSARATERLIIQ